MEEFGRLTFPNSRTASPVIDQDLVITRGITANWGAQARPPIAFTLSIKKPAKLVGLPTRGTGPRTIPIRIRIWAGWAARGSFIRLLVTAAWYA